MNTKFIPITTASLQFSKKTLSALLILCSGLFFSQKKNVDSVIQKSLLAFPEKTEFSVAVIKNGKTTFYGYRNEGSKVQKVDNKNSLFEIGSVTKVFTASLLAQEVANGKVNLEDNLHKFLPDLDAEMAKISLNQLATHSSGLPRLSSGMLMMGSISNPYKDYSEEKLIKDLYSNQIRKDFVGKYDYSNFGTSVLGYSLAKMNSSSYENLVLQRIFKPVKMSNSTFNRTEIKGNFVSGLDASGKVTSGWDMNAANPAGGIISSASDMTKFLQYHLNSKAKWTEMMQKPQLDISDKLAVGLGWHILLSENILWHNGGTGGYRSFVAIDPKNKNAVVVLSNVSSMHPKSGGIDQLGITILKN